MYLIKYFVAFDEGFQLILILSETVVSDVLSKEKGPGNSISGNESIVSPP